MAFAEIRGQEAAVELFRRDPPRVDRAPAATWLPAELDAPAEGVCRVVVHSSVWIYLEPAEQATLVGLLEQRGAHATPRNPLAWLRHEDTLQRPGQIEVRLTLWPPGEEIQLARSHPHGRRVEWLAAPD